MKPNQSGTIRRRSKPKPLIITLIILAIIGGVILMIIPFMIEKESGSGSRLMIDGRFRFITILDPGDKLEMKYSMNGEETEIYFTKGAESSIVINDEDILRYIPNASLGKISYAVGEERGIYTVHFIGRNCTVDYTYRITNIYENLGYTGMGLVIIISGIMWAWRVFRIINPKYIRNSFRYYSLFLLTLGLILMLVVFMFNRFRSLSPFSISFIILSAFMFFYNKTLYNSYLMKIHESPKTIVKKIKKYLIIKKIEFKYDKFVKEKFIYWHTVFHLKDLSIKIKVANWKDLASQTMIILGKQTEQNRIKLIRLTNNIANRLKCENFRLISE